MSDLDRIFLTVILTMISFVVSHNISRFLNKRKESKIQDVPFGLRAVRITEASKKLILREFPNFEFQYMGAYFITEWVGVPPRRKCGIMHPIDFHNMYEFVYKEEADHLGEIRYKVGEFK